jgi:hypothetical protein
MGEGRASLGNALHSLGQRIIEEGKQMNAPLSTAVATHNALREKLKAEFGLEDDDEALIDTLDGISDLKELIAVAARQARYEAAQAEACKAIIAAVQARMARRAEKAERLRDAIAHAMEDAGERKIDAPDCTISVRAGKPKLVIERPCGGASPGRFVNVKRVYSWNVTAISEAIALFDQEAMDLAHWSNPEPILTLRSR